MTVRIPATAVVASLIAALVSAAAQADPNWKRGRLYYRMVCTDCHAQMAESIPPASRTKAQWQAYLAADAHDASGRTNPSVRYYISQEYRAKIQDENRAAKHFLEIPDDEMFADVEAFVQHGAADSDTPASCQ